VLQTSVRFPWTTVPTGDIGCEPAGVRFSTVMRYVEVGPSPSPALTAAGTIAAVAATAAPAARTCRMFIDDLLRVEGMSG
jgi:hypothetical protein